MSIFRRRKDLPPPMDPKIPPAPPGINIPYVLADYPRQLLNWLAQYSELTEKQRDLVANLLLGYNEELAAYLVTEYGYEGLVEADGISKKVAASFWTAVHDEYKSKESELFTRLEEDWNKDE